MCEFILGNRECPLWSLCFFSPPCPSWLPTLRTLAQRPAPIATGPLSLSGDGEVAPHEFGVRCESCHGPGSLHAADPAANRVRNPARMAAADLNALCAKCHRIELGSPAENRDVRDARNVRNQPL